MGEIDINAALGESYEFGDREILPESYYPCMLTVLSTGASKEKMVPVKDAQGNPTGDEEVGGNTPFVELIANVFEGPFAGKQITRKAYITPGGKGGALGRWLGACHAITGMHAPTGMVCAKFGIALPTAAMIRPEGKETVDQAARKAVRLAIAEGFYAMDAATRVNFIATLLNIPAWDGKRCIVKLDLESQEAQNGAIDPATGKVRIYWNNTFAGFIPLSDEKKGMAWWRAIELPKQVETKQLMDAQAGAATGA